MAIILFDNRFRKGLYPFTLTNAVAVLRFGIFSVKERWEHLSGQPVFISTEKYLQALYEKAPEEMHTWIDASVMADADLTDSILALEPGCCIADEKGLIAGRLYFGVDEFDPGNSLAGFENIRDHAPVKRLEHPWQLIQWNDRMIREDIELVKRNSTSSPIHATVNSIAPENIFIEPGAKLQFCTLNASTGPIYIGKNAEVMEGSVVRGPFVLGEGAVLKMNSRIYGATTLGPYSMGGGEIKNTVIMGYSNKAHDGYLGDAVVGHWCNFGAGSTNSNVKNTAGEVKLWDMGAEKYMGVGQKCGVIMGDYSRVAINSSINTGTMIGVSANVFGTGLLPTIIGNFSWGVNGTRYDFAKALTAIENWKKMKNKFLLPAEAAMLKHIFEMK